MHTRPFRHPLPVLLVFVGVFLVAGCSLFSGNELPPSTESAESTEGAESAEGAERTDTQIFVGDTIEMNYDPNVIMKRAESFHEKEGYAEAIVEYQHFLDLHSNHVLAPYAQYRLALSHFKMVGTIDLDVTPVIMAREAFVTLMTEFPDSQYEAEALDVIRQCDRHLAQHHVFVGDFYYRKEAYMAAEKRFRKVIDTYPDVEEAIESKLYLTKTYQAIGAVEWARDWALTLVQQHPRHPLRSEGLQVLAALHEDNPGLADTDLVDQNALLTTLVPANASFFESQPSPTNAPLVLSQGSGFRIAATVTSCHLGSWCEAMGASPRVIPTPQSPVLSVVMCRPGAWCE